MQVFQKNDVLETQFTMQCTMKKSIYIAGTLNTLILVSKKFHTKSLSATLAIFILASLVSIH